jgi:hypothetical protein
MDRQYGISRAALTGIISMAYASDNCREDDRLKVNARGAAGVALGT